MIPDATLITVYYERKYRLNPLLLLGFFFRSLASDNDPMQILDIIKILDV